MIIGYRIRLECPGGSHFMSLRNILTLYAYHCCAKWGIAGIGSCVGYRLRFQSLYTWRIRSWELGCEGHLSNYADVRCFERIIKDLVGNVLHIIIIFKMLVHWARIRLVWLANWKFGIKLLLSHNPSMPHWGFSFFRERCELCTFLRSGCEQSVREKKD